MYFWRDNHGNELDCLIEKTHELIPIEIKAGKTISPDYFEGINYWNSLTGSSGGYVIYGGNETIKTKNIKLINWKLSTTLLV